MHWKSTTCLKWEGLCGERRVCFPGHDYELGSVLQEVVRSPSSFLKTASSESESKTTKCHVAGEGLRQRLPPPNPLGRLCFAVWGLLGSCTQAPAPDCFLSVCVLFFCYCHRSFPQNKYLMLLLSLHLIKMYRICAVNSNETNKTRAPSLEGIRCEWKMSLQTKKFCSKQGLQREVSPVMTSIKYTNGTFSTILNMAFSVLYTQSKWFDHRA